MTVLLQSPYILTQAYGSAEGVDKVEVSVDDGKTWKTTELKDFGAVVKGKCACLVTLTVTDALKDLPTQGDGAEQPRLRCLTCRRARTP